MSEDILLQVMKPARYIGEEWNISRKDFSKAEVRFALGFPDLYEVGMSNLGIRILYNILNGISGVACERFFCPNVDMEKILRSNAKEIFSLESKTPLNKFDIVGFSLGSELCYTNVLNILELANIPIQASLRDNKYPLIIAGGPCTLNPEPMHEFFDLFVIGESEDLISGLIQLYRENLAKFKTGQISKQDLLLKFSQIQGVYVPSFYDVLCDSSGKIKEFKSKVKGAALNIRKSFVENLNAASFPVGWLVPYIQIIHDRITLEITRGCPNRCRFCQARSQYYPLRQRSVDNIFELALEAYKRSGYEDISLTGLSVSDYPHIEELLLRLINFFKEKAVSVSLPSLKARALVGNLSSLIATIKKTGLTFAPEAGSERLRNILAKDFEEEEFFNALEEAYRAGYQHVKLYFMIGLPFEKEEDLDAIVAFSLRVSELRRKVCGRPAEVNISINALIPKPHTPFQWFGMEESEKIKEKQNYLREKINKYKRLKVSFHQRNMSILEGVLSRGDRRLSQVILRAFKNGARFDAWAEHFNFEIWREAFEESQIDPEFYLKEKSKEEILPWDFIDVGLDKNLLKEEFNKVIAIKEEPLYNSSALNKNI